MMTKLHTNIELGDKELSLLNDPKIQEEIKKSLLEFISKNPTLNIEINSDIPAEDISKMIIDSCSYCEAISLLYHRILRVNCDTVAKNYGFATSSVVCSTSRALYKIIQHHRYALTHSFEEERKNREAVKMAQKLSLNNYLSKWLCDFLKDEHGFRYINELAECDSETLSEIKSAQGITNRRYEKITSAISKYREQEIR